MESIAIIAIMLLYQHLCHDDASEIVLRIPGQEQGCICSLYKAPSGKSSEGGSDIKVRCSAYYSAESKKACEYIHIYIVDPVPV